MANRNDKWTIGGVPMTAKQIDAIKQARAAGDSRIVIETDTHQAAALKRRAADAGAELAVIADELAGSELPAFAATIRARRRQMNMTLDQLSELTGISKANLSKLERGRLTNPTIDTLRRIGEGLDLELTINYTAP